MMTDQTPRSRTPQNSTERPKPRRGSRLFKILGVLVLLLILLVLLLPTLISTGSGKSLALGIVNKSIAGEVTIDELSIGWFSSQYIAGLRILDPDGETVVHLDEINAADVSLFRLLRGSLDLGRVTIVNRKILIVEVDEQGTTNLATALSRDSKNTVEDKPVDKPTTDELEKLNLKLDISGGTVSYQPWKQEAIVADNLKIAADIPDLEDISGTIAAQLRQGANSGHINGNIASSNTRLDGRFELKLLIQPESWKNLVVNHPTLSDRKLQKPFEVLFAVSEFTLPRDENGYDFTRASIHAQLSVDDVEIAPDQAAELQQLALRKAHLLIQSKALGELLHTEMGVDAYYGEDRGTIAISADVLNFITSDGQINANAYQADVKGGVANFPVTVPDQLLGYKGLLVEAISSQLNATIEANLQPDASAKGVMGRVAVLAESDMLHADIRITKTPDRFELLDEENNSNIQWRISKDILSKMKGAFPALGETFGEMELAQPTVARIDITAFSAPDVDEFDLAKVHLGLTLSLQDFALQGDPRFAATTAQEVTLTMPPTLLGSTIDLSVHAGMSQSGEPFTATANSQITGLLSDNPVLTLKADVNGLPTQFVDDLTEQNGILPIIFGPQFNTMTLALQPPASDTATQPFEVILAGGDQTVRLVGRYNPEEKKTRISLLQESSARLTVTPQMLDQLEVLQPASKLLHDPAVAQAGQAATTQAYPLEKPVTINLTVNDVLLTLAHNEQGEMQFDPARSRINLRIATDEVSVRLHAVEQSLTARGLTVNIQSDTLSQSIAMVALADYQLTDHRTRDTTQGKLDSRTQLLAPFDNTGAFSNQTLAIDSTTTLTNVPVALIDQITEQEGKLVLLLTSTLDSVSLSIRPAQASNDPSRLNIAAVVNSTNLNAPFSGKFEFGRFLELKNDAPIRMRITPEAYAAFTAADAKDELDTAITDGQNASTTSMRPTGPVIVELNDLLLTIDNPVQSGSVNNPASVAIANIEQANPLSDTTAVWYGPANTLLQARIRLLQTAMEIEGAAGPQTFEFPNLLIDLKSANMAEAFDLNITGNVINRTGGQAQSHGSIASKTTVRKLFNHDWSTNMDAAVFDTNTALKDFPAAPLDSFLGFVNGEINAAFDGQVSMSVAGPITFSGEPNDVDISVASRTTNIPRIALRMGDEITLRDDVNISMLPTPAISELILKHMNFALKDVQGADEPMNIRIISQVTNPNTQVTRHFHVPLERIRTALSEDNEKQLHQAIRDINIDVVADLGTLMINTQDSVLFSSILTGLQKMLGGGVNLQRMQKVKFTRMQVAVNQGEIRTFETWMIGEDFILGLKGSANAIDRSLNFASALLADAVMESDKAREHLRPQDVMEFKVEGTIDNAKPLAGEMLGRLAVVVVGQNPDLLQKHLPDNEILDIARNVGAGGLHAILSALKPDAVQLRWKPPMEEIRARQQRIEQQRQQQPRQPQNPPQQEPGQPAEVNKQPPAQAEPEKKDPLKNLIESGLNEILGGDKDKKEEQPKPEPTEEQRQRRRERRQQQNQ